MAQPLYAETPESIAAREAPREARAYLTDPAHAIEQGRPTKRDRRELVDWQRWSASSRRPRQPELDGHRAGQAGDRNAQ